MQILVRVNQTDVSHIAIQQIARLASHVTVTASLWDNDTEIWVIIHRRLQLSVVLIVVSTTRKIILVI
jgi:hypothetical protein